MTKRGKGRPSDLKGIDKQKITLVLDSNLIHQAKLALLTTHRDSHITLSGMIIQALSEYLEKPVNKEIDNEDKSKKNKPT